MKVLRLFLEQAGKFTLGSLVLSGIGGLLSGAGVLKLQELVGADHVTFLDAAIVGALGLSQTLTSIGARFVFARGLYNHVLVHLRRKLIHTVSASTLRAQEQVGNPRLWAALDSNSIQVALAGNSFVMAARSVTTAIGCIVAIALKAPALLPSVIGALVVGLGLYAVVSRRAARAAAVTMTLSEGMDRQIDGLTRGNRELRQNASRRFAFLTQGLTPAVTAFQQRSAASSTWNAAASRLVGLPLMALIGSVLFLSVLANEQLPAFRSSIVIVLFLQAEIIAILGFADVMRRGELALGRTMGVIGQLSTTEARGEAVPPETWSKLQLDQVTTSYVGDEPGRKFTLGPVNLTIEPGEIVFIIGGNGSGKSTLAKVLTGLYVPDSGTVQLDGRPIDDKTRESYRQLFTGIFSNHHVYQRLFGIEATDREERGRELLKKLELSEKVDIKNGAYTTTQLSSGQKKRLSMVTSRLEDRRLMVLDEWASDQDPHFRDLFYRQILPELKAEGRTIIVISHDDRYFDSADRIIRLEDGQVVSDARPARSVREAVPQAAS